MTPRIHNASALRLLPVLGVLMTAGLVQSCADEPVEDAVEDTKNAVEEVADEIEDATN